jgi:hypothetical protein
LPSCTGAPARAAPRLRDGVAAARLAGTRTRAPRCGRAARRRSQAVQISWHLRLASACWQLWVALSFLTSLLPRPAAQRRALVVRASAGDVQDLQAAKEALAKARPAWRSARARCRSLVGTAEAVCGRVTRCLVSRAPLPLAQNLASKQADWASQAKAAGGVIAEGARPQRLRCVTSSEVSVCIVDATRSARRLHRAHSAADARPARRSACH